jgi:hypothetical protein
MPLFPHRLVLHGRASLSTRRQQSGQRFAHDLGARAEVVVVILLLGEVDVVLLEQLLGGSNLHDNARTQIVTDAAQLFDVAVGA